MAEGNRGYYYRASAPFVCGGEEQFVEVVDNHQTVRRCRLPSNEVIEEVICPLTWTGCYIEKIAASPTGAWLVTQRTSGQGEWGYDVFRTGPLTRVAGTAEGRGYILDLPRFADDESRVIGVAGRFLEWWWEGDEESDGPATVGFLFVHLLPGHEVTRHELRVELPRGWKPENRRTLWYLPRDATPVGEGVRLVPSGGVPVEIPGPLPPVIILPAPHPSGKGLL